MSREGKCQNRNLAHIRNHPPPPPPPPPPPRRLFINKVPVTIKSLVSMAFLKDLSRRIRQCSEILQGGNSACVLLVAMQQSFQH